jgi:hypothetical protein
MPVRACQEAAARTKLRGEVNAMTAATRDDPDTAPGADGLPQEMDEPPDRTEFVAGVSVALSAMGFMTLLRLADRRDRSPARGLFLFLATSVESIGGTVLGMMAVGRSRDSGRPTRGVLLGAAGTVLGIVTTVLNVNWMRTRRRL